MTTRGEILSKAKELTEGERNAVHGEPKANMECFIKLFSVWLENKYQDDAWRTSAAEVTTRLVMADGAEILMLHKLSRILANSFHADNYVDLAAYSAIAGECAGVSV